MKKKILSFALAMLCMGACLVGCGDKEEESDTDETNVSEMSEVEKYAAKSKISAMNRAAESAVKAMSYALEQAESVNDIDISFTGWIDLSEWDWDNMAKPDNNGIALNADNAEELLSRYFREAFGFTDGYDYGIENIDKLAIYVDSGICTGACFTKDGERWGAYPKDIITYTDYEISCKMDMQECMNRVEEKIK